MDRAAGSVPYIRLMLWSSPEQGREEKQFTLQRILNGEFDEDFRSWARAAAGFGSPVIAEFGTEVNGKWYPWNGWWNGQGEQCSMAIPLSPTARSGSATLTVESSRSCARQALTI